MSDDRTAVHVDEFLPHPPERVWRALVDPEQLSAWFMPTDFAPRVGHRFTFRTEPIPATRFSGTVRCEVLEVRRPELLRYTWSDAENPGNTLASTVTWTLRPEGRGTRLFLEHRGFDPDDPFHQRARTIMSGGWRSHVIRRLGEFLAGQAQGQASPASSR
jgi:uncharacterized protein YndB with AHSA1/START domain